MVSVHLRQYEFGVFKGIQMDVTVGEALRAARLAAGVSLDALAARVHFTKAHLTCVFHQANP
jgi:hypothetical protein